LCGDVSESDLKAQQEELAVVNAALAEAQAEVSIALFTLRLEQYY
jgi:hypothetical protein